MKMCMLLLASLFIVISPLNSDYTNMMKWLTENKAVISPKLSLISENEYNRYIITTEDVKSEEQLVFIPSNLFISINHDIIHPICKKVMGIGAHNSFNCLIYFLTIDKTNEHSFWKYYYSFLPIIQEENFPYYYNENDRNIICNTEAKKDIEDIERKINEGYQSIKNHLKKGISYEEYKKNYIYVLSRNFARNISILTINTLVPYLDMFNHANENNCDYQFTKDGVYLIALHPIKAKEQLTVSYGYNLSNVRLLTVYGFTLQEGYRMSIHFSFRNNTYTISGFVQQNQLYTTMKRIQEDYPGLSNNDVLYELKELFKERKSKYYKMKTRNKDVMRIVDEESFIIERYLEIINEFL